MIDARTPATAVRAVLDAVAERDRQRAAYGPDLVDEENGLTVDVTWGTLRALAQPLRRLATDLARGGPDA